MFPQYLVPASASRPRLNRNKPSLDLVAASARTSTLSSDITRTRGISAIYLTEYLRRTVKYKEAGRSTAGIPDGEPWRCLPGTGLKTFTIADEFAELHAHSREPITQ